MSKFGFIIHPLKIEDFFKKFPALKYIPKRILKKSLKYIPPLKVSRIKGIESTNGAKAEGYFLACPLLPNQLLNLDQNLVKKRIIQAGQRAEELGAKIVGLGAFTSVVGDKGISIANQLDIAVTTGNSYTVATAIQAIEKIISILDLNMKNIHLAVVGGTGSIGKTCAELMSGRVGRITLIGRKETKLQTTKAEIYEKTGTKCLTSNTFDKLPEADIIITVTSDVDAVIDPQLLKPGSVVCDIARPRDISNELAKKRDDILIIDGGIVKIPGNVDFGFNFGFPPETAYACMAETIILALENKFENYSLGSNLETKKVKEISSLAEKHGFKLAGMRSFDRALNDNKIHKFKKNLCSKPANK